MLELKLAVTPGSEAAKTLVSLTHWNRPAIVDAFFSGLSESLKDLPVESRSETFRTEKTSPTTG